MKAVDYFLDNRYSSNFDIEAGQICFSSIRPTLPFGSQPGVYRRGRIRFIDGLRSMDEESRIDTSGSHRPDNVSDRLSGADTQFVADN